VTVSAMAKQNLNKKKTQNQKNMTRPNSLPLLPPWGVQSCFFALLFVFLDFWFFSFLVFWFLFSGSLLIFCAMAKQNQDPKKNKKPQKNV
jgi:hypothetical protein